MVAVRCFLVFTLQLQSYNKCGTDDRLLSSVTQPALAHDRPRKAMSRQNDDRLRLEGKHVSADAEQHLRRGLPADPAVHIRLARKKLAILPSPAVGNGIAPEDDAFLIRRRRQPGVLLAIMS